MIELPEALTIACQMNADLRGKRIAAGVRGNAPHKFAFYSRPAEEYEAILRGKTLGEASVNGALILVAVEPDYVLLLGGGGERIRFHRNADTLPKQHQLWLRFTDETHLTVTVQAWGSVQLLTRRELARHPYYNPRNPSPIGAAFTWEYFQGLFAELEGGDPRAVKAFVISRPGILGVGNGYLQDILFRARLHPRRKAVTLGAEEQRALYHATRETLQQALAQGGRDTECDLYGRPGGYRCILNRRSVGQPCPACGTRIEKKQFLGGACYYCPRCQA